ncbi:MAG: hypothetical protein Q4G42_09660 [Neisseria sp.]|nr:hypothetical protein [Neisseria sp.]
MGIIVFLFGTAVIGFDLLGYAPEALNWMDQWGKSVDWGIKVTVVIVGAALYLVGGQLEG